MRPWRIRFTSSLSIVLFSFAVACSVEPTRSNGQLTATNSSNPTSTPEAIPTITPCGYVDYTVQPGDTLSSIALNYSIPIEALRTYNKLGTDSISDGQKLLVPLCERTGVVYIDPTATPTYEWDYPAPELLLPPNRSLFLQAVDYPVLQWTAVAGLLPGEGYHLEIELFNIQATSNIDVFLTITRYIIPRSAIICNGSTISVIWRVTPVRVIVDDTDGSVTWWPVGKGSESRSFDWQCVP
jgi:LysM repeat protein